MSAEGDEVRGDDNADDDDEDEVRRDQRLTTKPAKTTRTRTRRGDGAKCCAHEDDADVNVHERG